MCLAFAKTQPRKQQVGSKNKLVRMDGKYVILENVDILVMASFLGLLSLWSFGLLCYLAQWKKTEDVKMHDIWPVDSQENY